MGDYVMRVLLVEDEIRLADALAYILKKEGFITDVVNDGMNGFLWAQTNNYDVIILDRMLPEMDGIEILQKLRLNKIQTPTIFLTAKDTVQNRVEGLDAGADDYLIKPFSKEELLARVRALTRRSQTLIFQDQLELGSLKLNTALCQVNIANKEIKLSLKETQLLELLLRNKGQVLSKEQILDRIWGYGSDIEMKNVDLYIFYLRKKINFEKVGVNLETIRGVGYLLKGI